MPVEELIYEAMRQTNEIMGEYHFQTFAPEAGIMRHDTGEVLDSVDFVGFLMLLEDKVYREHKKNIKILGSGKVYTQQEHPFRTVATLAAYVEGLL